MGFVSISAGAQHDGSFSCGLGPSGVAFRPASVGRWWYKVHKMCIGVYVYMICNMYIYIYICIYNIGLRLLRLGFEGGVHIT